jgi:hypothetical protein
MSAIRDALETARAEVARLERLAATANCREVGCDMQHSGGMNCGCEDGSCSVPAFSCSRCGDSDYGDNSEAAEKRSRCAEFGAEGFL